MAKITPQMMIEGLTQRGLPAHVAQGFVMNAIDESGLQTGIEEGQPNVHGTRGYGLMQWTGDRRVNLERKARERGVSSDDLNLQLDMIVDELGGPEGAAMASLQKTTSAGQAGAVIVSEYLRPAKEHELRRRAAYTGRDGNVEWTFEGHEDADGYANTRIDPNTYADVTAPARSNLYEVISAESREPETYGSWLEEIGAQYESNSVTASAVRWVSEGAVDPTFEIGDERVAKLTDTVDPRYHDYVFTSGSETTLQSRLKWAAEDAARQQKLSAGGWSAAAAGFVAGAVDPIPLAAGVATGGATSALAAGGSAVRGVAVGAAAGAVENLGWEAANKYAFDNPNSDPFSAAILGAGFGAFGAAIARGLGGSSAESKAMHDLAIAASTGRIPGVGSGPVIAAANDSMGAARNTDKMDNLVSDELAYRTEVSDSDVPYGFGGAARIDVTGQMTTSSNPLTRSIGAALGEDSAGFTDHSVVADPASSRATALERRMVGNFVGTYHAEQNAYLKEQGIGRMSPIKAERARRDFGKAVRDYLMDPHPPADTPATVRRAGDNLRQRLSEWHDELTGSGLGTFDKDPHYFPLVSSPDAVSRADVEIQAETMHEFIRQAIRKQNPDLDEKLLTRMAEGYWRNLRKGVYGIEDDMSRALGTGDRDAFKEALNSSLEAGGKLSDEDLETIAKAVFDAVDEIPQKGGDKPSFGNRHLKRRTVMDHNFTATLKKRNGETVQMKVADLFDADPEVVFRRYSRVMSGRVALANTIVENPSKPGMMLINGIRSDSDVARIKDAIIESWRKEGVPSSDRRVQNDVANVDFMYKRITGTPVWDQSSALAMWGRRIRDTQFIRLMSNMGLNQVQEFSKIVALTGYKAAWRQLPSIKSMVKSTAGSLKHRTELERELQDLTGIGVDYLHGRRALRVDDDRIGESATGPVMRRADLALDVMSEITSHISLMRAIQDTQQRWAMSAISQQMAQMARRVSTPDGSLDLSLLSKADVDRLASIGMGRNDLEALFGQILKHGEFDGERLSKLNAEGWDPAVVSKFRVFIGRYTDRLIQQNDVGGLAKWMSHPVGAMVIQFRAFVFGAWGKSTLWTANHLRGDPRLLVMLAAEMAMGSATYAVRMSPLLLEEDGWDKFEEKVLNPAALAKNGWARTATASILPSLIDTALSATPAGPQFTNARSSGSATALWIGSPAVDQLDSALRFSKGALGSAFSDEWDFTQGDAKAGVRAFVPWGNWLPVAYGFSALTRGLPTEK